jgi:hypothetical protein
MNDQTKITTAVLAGYVLGRTKQGKRALRMAMWLSGGSGGVASTLGQQGLSKLEANPAIGMLLAQIRGPLADAGRKALTSALENKVNSLADNLASRTEALGLPEGAGKVRSVIDADQNDDEDDQDEAPPPRQRRSRGESRAADADDDERPRRPQRTSRTRRDDTGTATKKKTPANRASATRKREPTRRSSAQSGSGTTRRRGSTR